MVVVELLQIGAKDFTVTKGLFCPDIINVILLRKNNFFMKMFTQKSA